MVEGAVVVEVVLMMGELMNCRPRLLNYSTTLTPGCGMNQPCLG